MHFILVYQGTVGLFWGTYQLLCIGVSYSYDTDTGHLAKCPVSQSKSSAAASVCGSGSSEHLLSVLFRSVTVRLVPRTLVVRFIPVSYRVIGLYTAVYPLYVFTLSSM